MVLDAGFLPPNNANHDGEGYVNYAINAKAGLPTGTQIDALATIQFDDNVEGRLSTPLWRNTVDVSGPTSSVAALPAQSSPSFAVSWSGSDAGSGIASYDIYASTDGGPFTLWLDNTTATSASFNGVVGKTYGFYSVATDQVGYVEAIPAVADAVTLAMQALPSFIIAASSAVKSEGNTGLKPPTPFTFTISRTGDISQRASVQFTVKGIGPRTSRASAADFVGNRFPAGKVTFKPGQSERTITLRVLGDRLPEPNERFQVVLSSSGSAQLATAKAGGLIRNDDGLRPGRAVLRADSITGQLNRSIHLPGFDQAQTLQRTHASSQPLAGLDHHSVESSPRLQPFLSSSVPVSPQSRHPVLGSIESSLSAAPELMSALL